ncbi:MULTISPECIES: hypothetical protein [Streptomyces]|uniref:Uncharacterized protein n=1 Tax=Streptomyces yunnanensis TaxID=156453 RepID=A0A9X8QVJ1_9ACTN|nr:MULTISPECIES: hypothetical protein [Streptomyces]SHM46148.1 hypothetical protein SAMN05216268_11191 [Streptomyces yunnanensis]
MDPAQSDDGTTLTAARATPTTADCPDEADVGPDDEEKYRGLLPGTALAAAPATGHDLLYDHLYLAGAETFASADLPHLGDLFFREYHDFSDSVRQKLKLISAADVERAVASKKLTNVS